MARVCRTDQPMLPAFVQLLHDTDGKTIHRLAQFALAVTISLTAKLIAQRDS
jgi:hypothetical protein